MSVPPADAAAVRELAERDIAAGDPARALERLAQLPLAADDEAEFLAARAESALGRHQAARERFVRLRARLPQPSAMLEVHLAAACQKAGDLDAAIAALQEAIRLRPDFAAAHRGLASVLASKGEPEVLRQALRKAVAGAPGDAELWLQLAQAEASLGDATAAREALARAEALQPDKPSTWRQIGFLHAEYWRYASALAALDRASALDSGDVETETVRSTLAMEVGEPQAAAAALALAERRHPGNLQVAFGERLLLPQVYASAADAQSWRERFAEGLASLEAQTPRWLAQAEQVFALNRTNFLLAYQGEDDRELQRRYSALLAGLGGHAVPRWREPRERRFDGSRRLRVGFVANTFRECTAGRYFERWITGLDRSRFEPFVYHTSPLVDGLTERLRQASDRFEVFRGGTRAMAERLDADRLDVIVYPEVGMTPMSYVLAALRLAPVQLAGWGHPVTTGSDAIDGYFSASDMEPADAQAHYTERLIRLPGLGVGYAMPAPPPPATRPSLGLPEARRIYVCAQSLFKLHPEMDAIIAEVLERDPGGVVLLFQAAARRVTEQVASRLQSALAARGVPPRNQLKFLGRAAPAAFRAVLAQADVVLDTVRWSGGNTSLDAFSAGTPVVTHEGRFMRGRQTAGMLRLMGLAELIAGRPEDLARLAVEVARDGELNRVLRASIAERRALLFDRPEPVAAFADALLAAYN